MAALCGCRNQKMQQPAMVQKADSTLLSLQQGQQFFLEKAQFNLAFDSVLEDSRCPTGVQCIWAGRAVVRITAMGTYTRPQQFLLSTDSLPDKGYVKTVVFNGYRIQLQALTPYPSKEPPAEKSLYRLQVSVAKEGTAH